MQVGELVAKLRLDTKDFEKGVSQATKGSGDLTSGLAQLTPYATGAAVAIGAAAVATKALVDAASETYEEIGAFQRATGASLEESSRWKTVLEDTGLTLTDMTGTLKTFSSNVQDAIANPNGSAAAAFRELGVTLLDSHGKLRDTNDVLLDTMDALAKVPEGMHKTAIASDALGKSAANINKLFTEGRHVSEEYRAAVVMTSHEGQAAYEEWTAAVDKLNRSVGQVMSDMGDDIIPKLTPFVAFLADNLIPAFERLESIVTAVDRSVAYLGWRTQGVINYLSALAELNLDKARAAVIANSDAGFEQYWNQTHAVAAMGGSGYSPSTGASGTRITNFSTDAAEIDRLAMRGGSGSSVNVADEAAAAAAWTGMPGWQETRSADTRDSYGNLLSGGYGEQTGGVNTASFEYLINKLSSMPETSAAARAIIQRYNAARAQGIAMSRYNESQFALTKDPNILAMLERNRTAGGGGLPFGANEIYEMTGQLQREFSRIISTSDGKYDLNGNAIIYVTIDGQKVAESMVRKLELLGVKV